MSPTLQRLPILVLTIVLATVVLSACSTMAGSGGTVDVAMTSAHSRLATQASALPLDPETSCLFVDVERVELVPADGEDGGIVGMDVEATYDLVAIFSLEQPVDLTTIVVPPELAGTYHQVRFIVASAAVGFDTAACESGELADVTVPSGPQTGMKVNVAPPITVGEDGVPDALVTLEFNVDRLIETGSGAYKLSPTAVRATSEAPLPPEPEMPDIGPAS